MFSYNAPAVDHLQTRLSGTERPWILWVIDAEGNVGRCETSGAAFLGSTSPTDRGQDFLMQAAGEKVVRPFFRRARQEPTVAVERLGGERFVLAGAPDTAGGCVCVAVAMTAAESAGMEGGTAEDRWSLEVSRPFPTFAVASEAQVVVDPDNPDAVQVVHTVPTTALPKAVRIAVRSVLAREELVTSCGDGAEGSPPLPPASHLRVLS
jgi:hypothetical protein